MEFKYSYKGIGYQILYKSDNFFRIESEIGDFYGYSIESVVLKFRSAVKEGPQ